MRQLTTAALAIGCIAAAALWAGAEDTMPAVGQKAPDFSLLGSDGRAHGLRGERGRPVVLAFYPKAFTGG